MENAANSINTIFFERFLNNCFRLMYREKSQAFINSNIKIFTVSILYVL